MSALYSSSSDSTGKTPSKAGYVVAIVVLSLVVVAFAGYIFWLNKMGGASIFAKKQAAEAETTATTEAAVKDTQSETSETVSEENTTK